MKKPTPYFEKGKLEPWGATGTSGISCRQAFSKKNFSAYVENGGKLTQALNGLEPNTAYVARAFIRLHKWNDSVFWDVLQSVKQP